MSWGGWGKWGLGRSQGGAAGWLAGRAGGRIREALTYPAVCTTPPEPCPTVTFLLPACSPLQGQGVPELETTEIFISVYLDRLLRVDDQNYQHQASGQGRARDGAAVRPGAAGLEVCDV